MDLAEGIWLELRWFWLAIVLLGVVMIAGLAVVLRFGPRRGYWNQPAAELRAPGRRTRILLYALALLHVGMGLAAIAAPGVGVSALVVAVLVAVFYAACAQVMAIAAVSRSRERRSEAGEP